MTREEFDSYIEKIKVAEELKNCWKEIQIDWETDPEKIDLLQLRNADLFRPILETKFSEIMYRVDFVKTSSFLMPSTDIFEGYIDHSYAELYRLIKNGIKLIPPATILRYSIEEGEHILPFKSTIDTIDLIDGNHRIRLSQKLGIEEIPILTILVPCELKFSIAKWNIECDEKNITLTHKDEIKKLILPLKYSHFARRSSENYVFYFIY